MSDYINREMAADCIVLECDDMTLEQARQAIKDCPTADVVKVRHGEWIYGESEEGHDGYRCSKCGEFIPWEYDEYDIDFVKEAHYCPNCGARMDGGNDE